MPIKDKIPPALGLAVAGCICALLLVVPSWEILAQDRDAPGNSDAVAAESVTQVAASPLPVEVTRAIAQSETRTRSFAGTVEAVRTVDLAFQISGQLIDFPVITGDQISAGDFIGGVDKTDFQLARDRAQASYDLARTEFDRASALSERGVTADAQFETARAQLAQAEVALREAERRLSLTEVRSPFDAIVARTFTEAFSNVTPAQPVIRLQDVSDLVIRISLPEDLAALARVQPDLFSVTATFPAAPGYTASLEPRSFATDANAALRTFDIEFRIVGDIDPRILPSMTANVSIGESEHTGSSGAVIIPVSAVDTTSRANPTVWIYDSEERTVTRRDVRLGLPLENSIVVLDGLRAGELLVSGGWWRLRDGSQVSAIGL
ncbi:MAG: efflux RND transporter periplasmic adaptor subunit [Limnobacter sp.]|nr:efflux RND transporter periplasmic adaptor subunit [Limnobacter sp.]